VDTVAHLRDRPHFKQAHQRRHLVFAQRERVEKPHRVNASVLQYRAHGTLEGITEVEAGNNQRPRDLCAHH
jgi:hypothetical protein